MSRVAAVKPATEAQARQVTEVLQRADCYAIALLTCRLHQNQENRREVERMRKALERTVLHVLNAAQEIAA